VFLPRFLFSKLSFGDGRSQSLSGLYSLKRRARSKCFYRVFYLQSGALGVFGASDVYLKIKARKSPVLQGF